MGSGQLHGSWCSSCLQVGPSKGCTVFILLGFGAWVWGLHVMTIGRGDAHVHMWVAMWGSWFELMAVGFGSNTSTALHFNDKHRRCCSCRLDGA
jgi:hypothetical protein